MIIHSESSKGCTKELRNISWNDKAPKYDIRELTSNNGKMGKRVPNLRKN